MTLFIFEKTDKSHQRKLATILGVDYVATSRAWISPILLFSVGIGFALYFEPVEGLTAQIITGVIYGFLIYLAMLAHGTGHIISSRMVGAVMTTLMATATVPYTYYNDTEEYPSRVHIGRAIGGPALNLLFGGIALALYFTILPNHYLEAFGIANLFIGVFTLMPISTLDGGTILRELRDSKK